MYGNVPWVRIPLSPPFSPSLQRLIAQSARQRQKFPRVRGVLAVEASCVRTGDGGFRAWKTPRPAFVSAAKSGGSDSLQIRLSEA